MPTSPGEVPLGKPFLAMVWVVIPALIGSFVGTIAGGIAAAIFAPGILGMDGDDGDRFALTIGAIVAATFTLVGAIAGAAAAIVWAIDAKKPGQRNEPRFGDRQDDFD
jgi:hypothetical protein